MAWDTHLDSAAIVAALLEAGADEHAEDAHGLTPLALATQAKGGAAPAVRAALYNPNPDPNPNPKLNPTPNLNPNPNPNPNPAAPPRLPPRPRCYRGIG